MFAVFFYSDVFLLISLRFTVEEAGVLLKLGGYGLIRVFILLFKFGFVWKVVI